MGGCGTITKMVSENEAEQGPCLGRMGGEGTNKGQLTNRLKASGWWQALEWREQLGH